jgi:hypothetical protein
MTETDALMLVCRPCRVSRPEGWEFTGLVLRGSMQDLCEGCQCKGPILYGITTDEVDVTPIDARWAEPLIEKAVEVIESAASRRNKHDR